MKTNLNPFVCIGAMQQMKNYVYFYVNITHTALHYQADLI